MDKILFYDLNNFGLLDKGYELYLRDFVNHSRYFAQYGIFYPPITECHGEDDANAKDYSLDFKRFVAQDECRSKRLLINTNHEIITSDNTELKTNGYYNMFKCIQTLSLQDFYKIKKGVYHYEDDLLRRELENFVDRLLMKNKNILLYLPKIVEYENSLMEVLDFFENALKNMCVFRQKHVKKDLYFSFILSTDIDIQSSYQFVVCKYEDEKLKLVDIVNTDCSIYFN